MKPQLLINLFFLLLFGVMALFIVHNDTNSVKRDMACLDANKQTNEQISTLQEVVSGDQKAIIKILDIISK